MNTHTYSDNPNKSMNSKTINLKPFLTTTLILTLGIIGLANTISQALPAIHSPLKSAWMSDFEGNPREIIQTPEIEQINIDSKKEIKEIINQLNCVDPQKPTTTKLEKKSKGEVISNNNNLKVSIKSNRTISMDNGRNKISLRVDSHQENQNTNHTSKEYQNNKPKLVDNKIIYEGTKVDTIVESVDGGIRQTINIKDPTAPKVYNFPMELKIGEKIIINQDGSANVVNVKGESIATILKPWARDAESKDLKTFYTVDKIDKNALQQHIVTNHMTKYPVKADPTWCGDFWNDVGWVTEHEIYRNNRYGQIVRVTPSWHLDMISKTINLLFDNPWLASDSWRELLDRLPANNNAWPNRAYGTEVYWSLHNQMACHIDGVKLANTANQVGN